MKKSLLLTITMLVSDREDTIEKCMKSLKPLLDSVPSELIVVDTAGNQKCMEVVRNYTDQIVRFQWCNDFAAARNAGLVKARGKWAMYLDDDEWFEDTTEIRDFFLKGIYKKYKAAAYITRNYTNKEGTHWDDRKAVRLTKITDCTMFVGKIHEQFVPMEEPVYYMKAYVHHFGYVFASEPEKLEHSWRNIGLLSDSWNQNREDCKTGGQLIQEYIAVKEYFSAIEIAKKMRGSKDAYEYGKNEFTAFAAVKEIDLYCRQEQYRMAREIGKLEIQNPKALLISRVCIASMMPRICLKLGEEDGVLNSIKEFHALMDSWDNNRVKNEVTDIFSMSNYYLSDAARTKIDLMELHVYVSRNCWEKAKEIFLKINWKTINEILNNTVQDIVDLIGHTEYLQEYTEAISVLLSGAWSQKNVYQYIKGIGEDKREREKVLYAISRIDSSDVKILKSRLYYAFCHYDKRGAELVLDQWQKLHYSFFIVDRNYWEGLKKLEIDLSERIAEVGIQTWITLVESLFKQIQEEECDTVYQVLIRGLKQNDIRFLHITGLRLEKQLLKEMEQQKKQIVPDKEKLWRDLYRIASLWVSCAAMLYQENVFQSELQTALPERYQFAWKIFQADALKNDSRSFVKKIAEAATCYLTMEDVCKYILEYYKTEAGE